MDKLALMDQSKMLIRFDKNHTLLKDVVNLSDF